MNEIDLNVDSRAGLPAHERWTMHKTLLAATLAAGLFVPAAYAQPASSPGPKTDATTEHVWTIRPAQVLAVAAGVVGGAVVVAALVDTEIAYVVGGVAGGYFANLWYNGGEFEVHVSRPPKT